MITYDYGFVARADATVEASGIGELRPGAALHEATRSAKKRALYEAETFFREAWGDIERCFGPHARAILHTTAGIVIKPDGIVNRATEPTLAFLADHELRVVAARALTPNRLAARLVWQFKQNGATPERLDVTDRLQTATPSLYLLVRQPRVTALPLTVRLTIDKGPSEVVAQRPQHLRSRLKTRNRFLNMVHSADEPADHVRELGILFTSAERQQVLAEAKTGRDATARACELAAALHAAHPRHDLDPSGARRRLSHITRRLSCVDDGQLRWSELVRIADAHASQIDEWDVLVLGAQLMEDSIDIAPRQLDETGVSAWTSAHDAT